MVGKPSNFVVQGTTVIEFRSEDAAFKAHQRHQGHELSGKKLKLTPIFDKNDLDQVFDKLKQASSKAKLDLNKLNKSCLSLLKGLETKKDDTEETLLAKVRALVAKWNDPYVRPESIINVSVNYKMEKIDGKQYLFVESSSEGECKALLKVAQKMCNGRDGLYWVPYHYNLVTYIEGPAVNDLADDNQAMTFVRDIVSGWKDTSVNQQMIDNVKIDRRDDKTVLVVTATTAENSKTLVKAKKEHMKGNEEIVWYYTKKWDN